MDESDTEFDGELREPWPALRDVTLGELELLALQLDERSIAEDVLRWLDRSAAFVAAAKRVEEAIKKVAISWINANGPLKLGDYIVYVVGHQTTTRCRNVRAMLGVVIELCDGDIGMVSELLSATAWKPGACRSALPPEIFLAHFDTVKKDRLFNGDPAPKELLRLDTRFIRRI